MTIGTSRARLRLVSMKIDDRYEILEPIGRGGMGTVYRARQTSVGREVALKLLHPDLELDAAAVARFQREAQAIGKLRHPNTLRLIDFGSANGRAFIVTELLCGSSLSSVLPNDRFDADRTLWLMRQISESLAEAHEHGIVHRDLKPSNIFIERVAGSELVKVVDFGIATMSSEPSPGSHEVVGTPMYMSPEQIRGEELDGRSDIYSLGIIAYECLAGRPPFVSPSSTSLMLMHLQDPPPRFAALSQDVNVPEAVEELVMEMLAKHRDDRPTADVLRTLLASDLEQTRRRSISVHVSSDRPLLSPKERSNLERAGFTLGEDPRSAAELAIALVSADAFNFGRVAETKEPTLHAIDATPDEIDARAIGDGSVLVGPLPVEGRTLGAALSWLQRPAASLIELCASGTPIRTTVIRDSAMKSRSLEAMLSDLERRGVPKHVLRSAERIADELLMNAFFHAPVDALGRPLYAERDRAAAVALHTGQEAMLQWAVFEHTTAIGVADAFGSMRLTEAMAAISSEGYRRNRPGLGAGLGLRTVLNASAEMIIALLPRAKCEVIALIVPEPKAQRRRSTLWLLQGRVSGLADDPDARKIGGDLFMRASPIAEGLRLELAGKIDETAELVQVFGAGDSLVLDLSAVRQINSAGVLRWINAWDDARARVRVTLERCPPDIVEQVTFVAQFADGMSVGSMLVPYYCPDCKTEVLEPIRKGEHEAAPRARSCRCGGSLELAESPETYFSVWKQ
jgi:serine/threonine protein kinase